MSSRTSSTGSPVSGAAATAAEGAAGAPAFPGLAERRREAILAAAEQVFAEKGYHEAGIADIAKLLGIGHGTFYRYFKNKHDIAVHIVERAMVMLAEVALNEDPEGSDSLDDYRAQTDRILTGWIELGETHPNLSRILHEQVQAIAMDRFQAMTDQYVAYTGRFLQNGVDKGFLRPGLDVELTAQMLVALILEGNRRALQSPDRAHRERWKRAGMALMFEGVGG